jgi:hypothetical protein
MNKEDLFAKMKYRLDAAYPQYEFIIKENALVMNNKSPSTFMAFFGSSFCTNT